MTTKFYVDAEGNYLGGFDGALPPEGAIEVASAPADARQIWSDGAWSFPALTLEVQRSAKLAALEQKRWEVETGGMMFNGMPAPTHRDARSVVTAAYIRATEDPTYTVPNYKIGPATFVTLDGATIIAYADALETHVQAAFDRESVLAGEIVAATTEAELAAIDIETGWPV